MGVMSALEEPSPLELGTLKGKRDPSTHKWKLRWEREVPWIHALLAAADNGGVAAYWHDKNPHGKKTSVADNLRKKLVLVAPVAEDEELPSGSQLLQRVETIVLTWRAREARKNAMNDGQWQAAVKQQREDASLFFSEFIWSLFRNISFRNIFGLFRKGIFSENTYFLFFLRKYHS